MIKGPTIIIQQPRVITLPVCKAFKKRIIIKRSTEDPQVFDVPNYPATYAKIELRSKTHKIECDLEMKKGNSKKRMMRIYEDPMTNFIDEQAEIFATA